MKTLRHLFTKYKRPFYKKPKALTHLFTTHQTPFAPTNHAAAIQNGYEKNVIVHRAVNLIARSTGSVPLVLYAHNKKVTHHALLTLLRQPNPFQGSNVFMESIVSHLLLSGNAYVEALNTQDEAPPSELHVLQPERVRVKPGAFGVPEKYVYSVQGQTRDIAVDPLSGQSSLLHLKLFHPSNDWYGLSPLTAARQAIACHNTVAQHNLSLLENGGRPSGALFFGGHKGATLSAEQRDTLHDNLSQMYRGSQNAGQMMILEGDFEWKEMGLSPKDMDFSEGKNVSAREIAQVFGVPPMLVGVPGDATFSNYREARLHLWEDTILPLLDRIINQLNAWLVPPFGNNLRLTYDADNIPPLAAKREIAWERMNQCTFLTTNEKREAMGCAPLKENNQKAPAVPTTTK